MPFGKNSVNSHLFFLGMVLNKRCLPPPPEELFINRPFIYFLNKTSSYALFMGHIYSP